MMLLRSLTKHVKDQNWFAVFLDFVIVVVGVFIGIQVANWNDARADRAREASYLAALKEDFGAVITELEDDIARYESIASSMTLLLDQSRKDEPDASLDVLNGAARQLVVMAGTPIVSGAYENLTGSGDLSIIKSHALKNAMSSFFAQVDVVRLVSNTHEMQLVNIFQPYIIENLDYTTTLRKDRGLLASDAFEPARIVTVLPTPEFRNVVAVKWDIATDLRNLLLTAVTEARAVEALLAEEAEAQ